MQPNLPTSLICCPLDCKAEDQLVECNHASRLNYSFSIDLNPNSIQKFDMLRMRKWNQTRHRVRRQQIKKPRHSRSLPDCWNPRLNKGIFMVPNTMVIYSLQPLGGFEPGSYHLYTKVAALYGIRLYWSLSQFYTGHKGYIGHWLRIYYYSLFSVTFRSETSRVSILRYLSSGRCLRKSPTNVFSCYPAHRIFKCRLQNCYFGY